MRTRDLGLIAVFVIATDFASRSDVAMAADTTDRWEVSAGGGVAIPFDDFADVADVGWLATPRLGFYIRPTLCVGAEYGFHSFDGKESTPGVDSEVTIHEFTAFAKFNFSPKPVSPYVRVLGGTYRRILQFEVNDDETSAAATEFGLGAGVGLDIRSQGPFGAFVDGVVHVAFTSSTSTFAGVQGGVTILFGSKP